MSLDNGPILETTGFPDILDSRWYEGDATYFRQ